MALLRVPFAEAIGSSLLLKAAWDRLSVPQQTVLLTFYGLPLPSEAHYEAWLHYNELTVQDELGYPVGRPGEAPPYKLFEGRELLFLSGRRSGKSSVAAVLLAYESALGGHEEYLGPSEQAICFWIAQDQRTAIINLNLVKGVFDSSPALCLKKGRKQGVMSMTAERIDLWPSEAGYGRVSIMCVPPKVSSMRGPSCPVAVLDELVAWPSDPEAADPDEVVYSTIRKAQLTFRGHQRLVLISSVGYRQGLIWKAYSAGTRGEKLPEGPARNPWRGLQVLLGTTAGATIGMDDPHVKREDLSAEAGKDDFPRECLSLWQDVESGAIDPALLDLAIEKDTFERLPQPGCYYTASIDAAFRSDSFTFTVCHADAEGGVMQDVVMEITPLDPEIAPTGVIDPELAFEKRISPVCSAFGIISIHADQYQAESLNALAKRYGLVVERTVISTNTKTEWLATFNTLLRQRRVRLLDNTAQRHQLLRLRKVRTENGNIQVRAPKNEHDDIALNLLLAAQKTAPFLPDPSAVSVEQPRTFRDSCFDQIMQQRLDGGQSVPEDWLQTFWEQQQSNY